MEMQRGVVGDVATIPALVEAAEALDLVPTVAGLCNVARSRGVPVVHCVIEWRADRAGTSLNTPMAARLAKNPAQILVGSPAVELVGPLSGHDGDLISRRRNGLTPFTGTDLDATLRSLGITTVIAAGVSVNIGVLGLCLSAADLGYRVVVPTDAVVGTPPHYAEEVIHHTLAAIATLTSAESIGEAWE